MTPAGTSNELDVQNEWEENIARRVLIIQAVNSINGVTFVISGKFAEIRRLFTAVRILFLEFEKSGMIVFSTRQHKLCDLIRNLLFFQLEFRKLRINTLKGKVIDKEGNE